jgi:hypothetical protein
MTMPKPPLSDEEKALRDQFAMVALPALVASALTHIGITEQDVARQCYLFADAMLIAREK